MKIENFIEILGADFYTGVPDSQLKALCDYLMETYGINPKRHIIGVNEGNCVALAAGYHLATGKVPVVYMQNSGEGNAINPIASLLNKKVYAIPCIFVIGWRGEPGLHDEPQHIFQGEITLQLLENMGIPYVVLEKEMSEEDLEEKMKKFQVILAEGRQVAFVVRKGALEYKNTVEYQNSYVLRREEVIEKIVDMCGDGIIISTTGKASRELFEIREKKNQTHRKDFLTVGSMGHASSIALGLATQREDKKIWIIDGDGAVLMHMGSMALVGCLSPKNIVHILINNEAHESVGGMPTVANSVDFTKIADGCGYRNISSVQTMEELEKILCKQANQEGPSFVEVKCAVGARGDLGRPTTTAEENKNNFMKEL